MGTGIIVCGLNGSGKSTLGKALSEKLKLHFIDNEDLFFPKIDTSYAYSSPRSRQAAENLLFQEISLHEDFVLSAVKGDYGENILSRYRYAVVIKVPEDIRMKRVADRSFQKFGNRALPGGDLYEQEKKFFDKVKSRTESDIREWTRTLKCPVYWVNGTKPVQENVEFLCGQIRL